jgi:HAE1 family hydrophobic/amphiphilic exporter-1
VIRKSTTFKALSVDEQTRLQTMYRFMFVYMRDEMSMDGLSLQVEFDRDIFGSFFLLKVMGMANDIYAQLGLVMLVGLLGKNAVLIVEFAVQKNKSGMPILQSAIEGAKARFRPILMTSFAFIAGLIPLVRATGPGAIGNRTIGSAALGGMLLGTLFGVILVPGLYYIFGKIAEGRKLIKDEHQNPLTEDFKYNEDV